jgi:uncharacterized protein
VVCVSFTSLPPTAAWRHDGARSGFEVAWFHRDDVGYRIEGCTAAIEKGQAWVVDYDISVDASWTTRSARVRGRSARGSTSVRLEARGRGRWLVDGEPAPRLDGCLDVDLESSVVTNTLPVHRMALAIGDRTEVPAAYVRSVDLAVERLDQTYARTADDGARQVYEYAAPVFDFTARLVYDESGLVLDYPGLAVRARP